MNLQTIERIRDAIRRCERRELDAATTLYRIDNVLGELDERYELEFSSTCDATLPVPLGSVGHFASSVYEAIDSDPNA